MNNLKTIIIKSFNDIPKNFTGIVKFHNGTTIWYKDRLEHREDGPAIEYFDGTKMWYKNGKLHREDGPAVEDSDGTKAWYINGKRHREDGSAIIWASGTKEWWLNDFKLTEEQHKLIMMFSKESREKLYENDNKGLKNLLEIK